MNRLYLVSILLMSQGQVTAETMIYGESQKVTSFAPYTSHESSGKRISDLMFDNLIATDQTGSYIPHLAESWSIEDQGVSVLITLRKGIRWHASPKHPKTQFLSTADLAATVRVLTSVRSQIPNKNRFHDLKHVETLSPQKARIHFKRALSDPLRSLMFKIFPAHILKNAEFLERDSALSNHPIGTGPFQFTSYNDKGEVLLSANPDYFKGKPNIPQVLLKTFTDQNIMAQSLMYEALDLITYVSPRDFSEIMGDQRLGLIPYDALSFTFFALNNRNRHLKHKRVRQALGHLVNRQEMLTAFFNGKGTLISGPFPPTSWAYNLAVKGKPYNAEAADTLLKNQGYVKKDGAWHDSTGAPLKFTFAVPISSEGETIKRISLALQGYFASAGIDLELKFMDWLVWKETVLRDHEYDLTIASWSFDDASNITSLFHSSSAGKWGNNFVGFKNREVDSLLTEASSTNDFDKRRAIYRRLHTILAEESPYIYLWTLMHHAAHSTKLSNVQVDASSFFKYVNKWSLKEGDHGRKRQ